MSVTSKVERWKGKKMWGRSKKPGMQLRLLIDALLSWQNPHSRQRVKRLTGWLSLKTWVIQSATEYCKNQFQKLSVLSVCFNRMEHFWPLCEVVSILLLGVLQLKYDDLMNLLSFKNDEREYIFLKFVVLSSFFSVWSCHFSTLLSSGAGSFLTLRSKTGGCSSTMMWVLLQPDTGWFF